MKELLKAITWILLTVFMFLGLYTFALLIKGYQDNTIVIQTNSFSDITVSGKVINVKDDNE